MAAGDGRHALLFFAGFAGAALALAGVLMVIGADAAAEAAGEDFTNGRLTIGEYVDRVDQANDGMIGGIVMIGIATILASIAAAGISSVAGGNLSNVPLSPLADNSLRQRLTEAAAVREGRLQQSEYTGPISSVQRYESPLAASSAITRPKECIQALWRASYNRRVPGIDTMHDGFLLLTNERLAFIEEKGISSRSYSPILSIGLGSITRCSVVGAIGKKLKIDATGAFRHMSLLFSQFHETDRVTFRATKRVEPAHIQKHVYATVGKMSRDRSERSP